MHTVMLYPYMYIIYVCSNTGIMPRLLQPEEWEHRQGQWQQRLAEYRQQRQAVMQRREEDLQMRNTMKKLQVELAEQWQVCSIVTVLVMSPHRYKVYCNATICCSSFYKAMVPNTIIFTLILCHKILEDTIFYIIILR